MLLVEVAFVATAANGDSEGTWPQIHIFKPAQRARHRKVDVDKGSPPIIFFTLDDEAPFRS